MAWIVDSDYSVREETAVASITPALVQTARMPPEAHAHPGEVWVGGELAEVVGEAEADGQQLDLE